MLLHEFKEERWRGSPPNVCIGLMSDVCALISRSELETALGGYLIYGTNDDVLDYIGVWGARKVSRFHQMLRSRGATLDATSGRPPNTRMKVKWVRYLTKPRNDQAPICALP